MESADSVVQEGWLIKSPPAKFFSRAKWRRRYFLLRRAGQLPSQYVLEYFSDASKHKLKGCIELDQCEQVETDVCGSVKKQQCGYMFDIRTAKRTFYLVAETRNLMDRWIRCICQVCGLKLPPNTDSQSAICDMEHSIAGDFDHHNSVPNSPCSISGPYIPISECISGAPPAEPSTPAARAPVSVNPFGSRRQSSMSRDVPESVLQRAASRDVPETVLQRVAPRDVPETVLQRAASRDVAADTVRHDSTADQPVSPITVTTSPTQVECESPRSMTGHIRSSSMPDPGRSATSAETVCPPRPPKPPHLTETVSHHRCGSLQSPLVSAESEYLTPRTPNTVPVDDIAPSHGAPKSTTATQTPSIGQIFNYDFSDKQQPSLPPAVNRTLKPRKISDCCIESTEVPLTPSSRSPGSAPPVVDRALKPSSFVTHAPLMSGSGKVFNLAPPPMRYCPASIRPQRAAPSPSPTTALSETVGHDLESCHTPMEDIEYLDLDIGSGNRSASALSTAVVVNDSAPSVSMSRYVDAPVDGVRSSSGIVYKAVDFVKTEAFNKTRQSVQEQRLQK